MRYFTPISILVFIWLILDETAFLFLNYSLFQLLCSVSFFNVFERFFYISIYNNNYYFLNLINLDLYYINLDYSFFFDFNLKLDSLRNEQLESLIFYDVKIKNQLNSYLIHFESYGNEHLEFQPLQNSIYVQLGETNLVFFRLKNNTSNLSKIFSIYLVYPSDYSIYLNKVQCFCFEEVILGPYEVVDLPVLFYLSKDIEYDLSHLVEKELYLEYLILSD